MEDDSRSFKISFVPLFTLIGSASTLGTIVGLIVRFGHYANPLALGFSLVACPLLSLLLAMAMAETTRVVVTPRGLWAPDYAGRRHMVEWSNIASVRPVTILSMKFLRLLPRASGRVPWLPLFLADMAGFKASVFQHAGAGNPLVAYLRGAGA